MPLPYPDDLTSLVLRTDFDDDAAWDDLRAALDAVDQRTHATYVSDTRFAGVSVQDLVDEEAGAGEDEQIVQVFLADARAMGDPSYALLAVDLSDDEPGRTFRLPARWFPDVSANLSIGNMGLADFADATDASGTFQGFDGESDS
ncbi:DUF6924 domain-containing protein [Streptomyces lateritius]|uniref:DUF6924 domain-containing protein n=1 Tax=Streptomyces lateritius TaxID=67313 RepID=UPI001C8B25F0|nr:hypothetical protein [Streptomyces lateritius]MBX9423692.1 hypothetical protein [Streptomyces lateritius]